MSGSSILPFQACGVKLQKPNPAHRIFAVETPNLASQVKRKPHDINIPDSCDIRLMLNALNAVWVLGSCVSCLHGRRVQKAVKLELEVRLRIALTIASMVMSPFGLQAENFLVAEASHALAFPGRSSRNAKLLSSPSSSSS